MIRTATAVVVVAALTACTQTPQASGDKRIVVTTSSIVADVVARVAGDAVEVVSVVPNGFDVHTYEPRPSEIELLAGADRIVIADRTLNATATQLATLSGDPDRIVDLNAGLGPDDRITRQTGGWNPHTWTDPTLVRKWVAIVLAELVALDPSSRAVFAANAARFVAELDALDAEIDAALDSVPTARRRLVVYHDAWEYFGRRYGLELAGVLQALDFTEPSAAEVAAMAADIRAAGVPVFFGSEVFPSDVLQALEEASGARYVADLADDKLPGAPGDATYGYVALMRANLALLVQGLVP